LHCQFIETRSMKFFDCCLSHFCASVSAYLSSAKHLPQRWNYFSWQTLPTTNRKHFFMNILYTESFCLRKTQNRTLPLGSMLLEHGHQFYYWNQPLIICMRVCYLDHHEAGLCCYTVMNIKNLLHPL
jgi:hypothetical protein